MAEVVAESEGVSKHKSDAEWEAATDLEWTMGRTYLLNSWQVNLGETRKEARKSNPVTAVVRMGVKSFLPDTHSSPRKESVVSARCSRESDEERTPPYCSASRIVPGADLFPVL